MVIIISYNKQTWNEYNDSQTADENLANGAIISADRLNNMETGISNNDTNKVNVSDMRKPASDVAGIEEVSTLQTQVDNSAVGTNLLLGTSKTLNTVTNASGWDHGIPIYSLSNVATVNSDTSYTAKMWISPASHDMEAQVSWNDASGITRFGRGNVISAGTSGYSTWTGTITAGSTILGVTVVFTVQQSIPSSVSYKEVKLERGSHATDWCPNPSEILTKADDSKVAHLSGANNFDTVPTYGTNNKPFAINDTGATTARPTGQAVGYQYFDTTLNKPIWYNGANWVDSTGTTV